MNKIIVNGKEYASLNDVPDEYKVMFGDKNNNGIPDFVEGILAGTQDMQNTTANISGNSSINANFTSFFFNGNQYNSVNDLPPEARQKVETALNNFEKNGFKFSMPLENQDNSFRQDTCQQNAFQMGSSANDQVVNQNPTTKDVMQEQQLSPNFKSRLIITLLLFVMAVIYIVWLLKII